MQRVDRKGVTVKSRSKIPGLYRYNRSITIFKMISVIDKSLAMNFSDKCCGKFSMCLTKYFCKSTCKYVSLDFSQGSSLRTLPWQLIKPRKIFLIETRLYGHR